MDKNYENYRGGPCPVCKKKGVDNMVIPFFYKHNKALYACQKNSCPYFPVQKDGTICKLKFPKLPKIVISDVVKKEMIKYGVAQKDDLDIYDNCDTSSSDDDSDFELDNKTTNSFQEIIPGREDVDELLKNALSKAENSTDDLYIDQFMLDLFDITK